MTLCIRPIQLKSSLDECGYGQARNPTPILYPLFYRVPIVGELFFSSCPYFLVSGGSHLLGGVNAVLEHLPW